MRRFVKSNKIQYICGECVHKEKPVHSSAESKMPLCAICDIDLCGKCVDAHKCRAMPPISKIMEERRIARILNE
jgi:hypothetical protein